MPDVPITVKRVDYENATRVEFRFPGVKVAIRIPDDVTRTELVRLLLNATVSIMNEKSAIFAMKRPTDYVAKAIIYGAVKDSG